MRIFAFLTMIFMASCSEVLGALGSFLATCFVLFIGFSVWNVVRIIPNLRGLYFVQRSIQLFLVPFLVFVTGAVLGIPEKAFMLSLASFLFTPWFKRVLPRQPGDAADFVRTTEEWPWPKRKWVRHLIATPLFLLGTFSC